jgi:hypothetical protein
LKEDESIEQCRFFLEHPLAIEDDMRLVSTVELMIIREKINKELGSLEKAVDDRTFEVLRQADVDFTAWYKGWDALFSRKYESAGTALGTYDPNFFSRVLSFLSAESADPTLSR